MHGVAATAEGAARRRPLASAIGVVLALLVAAGGAVISGRLLSELPRRPVVRIEVRSDLTYRLSRTSVPAGRVDIELAAKGSHTLTFIGDGPELLLEVSDGTDRATVTLDAGHYVIGDAIPGHRAAGETAVIEVVLANR